VLFNIPDGHTKSATPITTVPLPITTSNIKVIKINLENLTMLENYYSLAFITEKYKQER